MISLAHVSACTNAIKQDFARWKGKIFQLSDFTITRTINVPKKGIYHVDLTSVWRETKSRKPSHGQDTDKVLGRSAHVDITYLDRSGFGSAAAVREIVPFKLYKIHRKFVSKLPTSYQMKASYLFVLSTFFKGSNWWKIG